ncbi:MAG: hypothetical protein IAF38_10705 [Bacteroidia bacterium]|nr:hypothetical protein [Bacteroidia bacterium]
MNWRNLYFPEITISRRLRSLKVVLALTMLASVLISAPAWLHNSCNPFIAGLDNLHPIAEKIMFGFFVLMPLLILFSRKPTVFTVLFLLLAGFLIVADRNRLQPWFYQYLIMFFVLAFYNWRVDEPKKYTPVLNSLKLCVVLIFVWGGIHKLNTGFSTSTWPWMISSWNNVLTPGQIQFMHRVGYVIPFVEIFAGIALLFPTAKRIAIPLLISVNVLNLMLLGPLGQNLNPVLWVYHMGMIFFLYILFAGRAESKFHQWSFTFQFKPALIVVFVLGILPAISLFKSRNAIVSDNEKTETVLPAISQNQVKGLPVSFVTFTANK